EAEDGIRDWSVTGVQTCALPISPRHGILVVALAGCAGATSGDAHPSTPATSRTIDSTGQVDSAGRTSDEVIARPETAGVRPTEEIGRASCREREERAGGGGGRKR